MNIFVSLPAQTLELFGDDDLLLRRYAVSTARKGAGERRGSFMTPRGRHVIRARIGAGCAANTVFVGRRPTGEIWSPQLAEEFPGRDWMLTRILWLSGREPGFNRFGEVDTLRRYIYLHGSPDSVTMGEPGSIGCVRMRNRDIVELFDLVRPFVPVTIGEYRIVGGDLPSAATRRQGVGEVAGESDEPGDGCLHATACDGAGKVIGIARLRPEGGCGVVEALYVLPAWRGKGVAGNLLRRLLDAARTAGIGELEAQALSDSAPLFARLGFAAHGGAGTALAGGRGIRLRRTLSD